MKTRVLGISSRNGGIHELLKMKSKGKYQLHFGDTANDRKKNFILCDTLDEAIEKIRAGHHPRMKNISQKGQAPDTMTPSSLIILKQQSDGTWLQEAI